MKLPVYTYHLTGNLDNLVHIYADGKPCYYSNGDPILEDREYVLETIAGFMRADSEHKHFFGENRPFE